MRDGRRIILMRGLRQGAYGLLAVVLAIALTRDGFSPAAIGALVAISLVGDFLGTLVIGHHADRWGRRRTLVVLALLMALTGLVFGFLHWYPLLLLAAFGGTLGASGSETAPFLPIEQAMLGSQGSGAGRTAVFARYNLVASIAGACGALLAGLPALLAQKGLPFDTLLAAAFCLYALAALVVAWQAARLSAAVEAPGVASKEEGATWRRLIPPLPHSRGIVARLAALFSVDAFAGGLIGQTLLALFFHLRFGADLEMLAALFFCANLLSALSFLAAPWLARRFGLLNTMVFTHLPSNILLMLVPLMPTFPLAAALLLVRQCLSQLDVPTRQAYTMALVAPSERTAAASVTSLARSAGSATSPILAGVLLQGPLIVLGLPLLLSGGLKAAYDLALWAVFHRVPEDVVTKGQEI
ncbi:MAG TPA: MFS transporter [Ktedonobacterales bacterium]|jgi:MFS family permease